MALLRVVRAICTISPMDSTTGTKMGTTFKIGDIVMVPDMSRPQRVVQVRGALLFFVDATTGDGPAIRNVPGMVAAAKACASEGSNV